MKKRYWLFGHDSYYPCGPINDFVKDFDSLEELQQYLDSKVLTFDFWEILDLETREWVSMKYKNVINNDS